MATNFRHWMIVQTQITDFVVHLLWPTYHRKYRTRLEGSQDDHKENYQPSKYLLESGRQ
jgi:hypothetical protein